jgi:polar amino acid transport system substrate-binding protein
LATAVCSGIPQNKGVISMNGIRARSAARILCALALVALIALAVGCGSSSKKSVAKSTVIDGATINSDSSLYDMLPANVKTAGVLNVASDIPYPPWEMYVDPTSKQATGFDYDLSQAIAAKIGIQASFNQTPFDGIILSIKSGKNDMIMSDMYDNAEREGQGVSFVDYAFDGTSILVPTGNPKGVTNLDSLAGQTVACESGTTQQTLLQKLNQQFAASGKPAMTIKAVPNQPAALLAVSSGTAVGDLTDHSTAEYIAKTEGAGNKFEVVADPAAPNGYDPQVVGIGIVSTNTQLIDTVQKALQALIDEGSYKQIVAKYGLLPVSSAQVNQGGKPITSASPTP